MKQPEFQGAIAALLTARKADGSLDSEGVERSLDHVLQAGASGVVVAGGTGEYFDLSIDQRTMLLQQVSAQNAGRGQVIASNGAARLQDCVELAEHALALGVDALLLPPPHFYRYGQSDLEDFYRQAAKRIKGPILIYNLAAFCSPLEPKTIARLIEKEDNLIGVKDSSGSLASIELLAERVPSAARILGHDRAYVEALRRKLIHAVISGPAGVVPELSTKLFAADPATEEFDRLATLFTEALDQMDPFPYPWALKTLAQKRGLFQAQLPFDPGPARQEQRDELEAWFEDWSERAGI